MSTFVLPVDVINVNDWRDHLPDVDAVRPAHCPRCLRSSRPVGEPLGLVGHGKRLRQFRGVTTPDGGSQELSLLARRYRCTACNSTCTVVPREISAFKQYSLPTIVLSFAFWTIDLMSARAVRERLSTWQTPSDALGWPSLQRWAKGVGDLLGFVGSPKAIAERIVSRARGYCPATWRHQKPHIQAFYGATYLMSITPSDHSLSSPPS